MKSGNPSGESACTSGDGLPAPVGINCLDRLSAPVGIDCLDRLSAPVGIVSATLGIKCLQFAKDFHAQYKCLTGNSCNLTFIFWGHIYVA